MVGHIEQLCFKGPERCYGLLTWIDNWYFVASSGQAAIELMHNFNSRALSKWGLQLKSGSQLLMQTRGSSELVSLPHDCLRVNVMPVLGHLIAEDGAVRPSWTSTRIALMRAFWKQVRGAHGALTPEQMLQVIDKAVRPTADWHFSVWPFQRSIAAELDSLQASMICTVLQEQWLTSDDATSYHRRRARVARTTAISRGTWSKRWAQRFISFAEHFLRHSLHPANIIFRYHDAQWLQDRRGVFSIFRGVQLGRTYTRSHAGKPQIRWEEALSLARQWTVNRANGG